MRDFFSEVFDFSGVRTAQNGGQQKSVTAQKSKFSINFQLDFTWHDNAIK